MSITLRDYQQEAFDAVLSAYKAGIKKQLIALPCGTGKTVLFSALLKHFSTKSLVIAHRTELINQAADKLKKFWSKAPVGFLTAKKKELNKKIIIASIQAASRKRMLASVQNAEFKLLIIDEAHHTAAKSYKALIKTINPDLLIGVTATPARGDKKSLEDCFDKIVYSKEIPEMIDRGYLCPVEGRKIATYISLDDVKTRMGDYAVEDLERAINIKERNKLIVKKYKEHADKKKTVAFCNSVEHCIELAKEFRKNGIKAEAVYGALAEEDRSRILKNLTKGKIKVVTSCNVLTEGFDEPSVNCIIMARPTKSRSLYIQMAGRGFRICKGKENCLVLDFIDEDHRLRSKLTLKGIVPQARELRDDPKADEAERLEKQRQEEEEIKRKKFIEDRRIDLLAKEKEVKEKTHVINPILFTLPNSFSLITNEGIEFNVTFIKKDKSTPQNLFDLKAFDKQNNLVFKAAKELEHEELNVVVKNVITANKLQMTFFDTESSYFDYAIATEASKKQQDFLFGIAPIAIKDSLEKTIENEPLFKTKLGISLIIQQILVLKKYCSREKKEISEYEDKIIPLSRELVERYLPKTENLP